MGQDLALTGPEKASHNCEVFQLSAGGELVRPRDKKGIGVAGEFQEEGTACVKALRWQTG